MTTVDADAAVTHARRRLPRRAIAAAALAMVLAGSFAAHRVVRPPVDPVPIEADAVVVFSGDVSRLEGAAALVPDVAPVLVVSAPDPELRARLRCGQHRRVEVICVVPDPATTRGEARAFAAVAEERGWDHVVAVTSRDHLRRARLQLDRCWDGRISAVARGQNRHLERAVPYEMGAMADALVRTRGC
ncbi:MAG TPA: ElyC/SanA/YdcF family protein [Acidimicrobiales bacterium]|nr:ElyC/SanA/YdcF family protein [Acidimicrobiales bacterium]